MAQLVLTVTEEQAGRTVLSLLRSQWGLSTGCINRLKRTESGITCKPNETEQYGRGAARGKWKKEIWKIGGDGRSHDLICSSSLPLCRQII